MEDLEKKYSVENGKEFFDWNDAIDTMLKGNKDGKYNAKLLTDKAGEWTTCACGNLCSVIPRDAFSRPKDDRLADLGMLFYESVDEGSWHEARLILNKIERRSATLIRHIAKEKGLEVNF